MTTEATTTATPHVDRGGATPSLSRRQLLLGAGALGAAAAIGPARGHAMATGLVTGASGNTVAVTGAGTLVMVTLYGGNDALNTIVPVADQRYPELRGSLALDPATLHDIGDGFALHPALVQCKTLWDEGRMAAIHGVGFDGLDRSHFHCMDVWQSGSEHDTSTGWIGRWLDLAGTNPLDAVAVGNDLPLLLRGERRSAAVVPSGQFALPGDAQLADLLSTLSGADDSRSPLAAAVAASTADLLTVVDTVAPLLAATGNDHTADVTEEPPGGELTARLSTVATLIEAELPTRLYSVDLRGFDTHAGQAPVHAALLGQLDTALGEFFQRIGDRTVTVAVYSEFGRRVTPNASGGTDHGGGGTMLVAGHVRAGHHGDPPPLDALVEGDLATTTDFRSVLGGLLEGVLDIEAADVLEGAPTSLAVV